MRAPTPRRAKRDTAATREIEQLLATKVPLLDSGADHFTLLGLTPGASADEVRQTYFVLARKLHPDRLSAIGLVDDARNAQRLMAAVNAAFAVLNDNLKRAEYIALLERGGEAAVRAQEAEADELAMRIMRAEEAFRQGEMALRRDQIPQAIAAFQSAVELQPNESEYQALLAWAQFAGAPDKNAVAGTTRRALLKAADASTKSPTARFYLGRVERMLGKEKEALAHFQEVLRIRPSHTEAASEARVLEQRLKGKR
jgi:curved DNA-binding protein CbpA